MLALGSPSPNTYRSGIAHDSSGIAKVPIFVGRGLLGIALGSPMSHIYRSKIAHDSSGIAKVPIFVGPGLLMIAPGLPESQYVQVRDCS